MRVRIIKSDKAPGRESTKSIIEDYFDNMYESGNILKPPYNMSVLTTMHENCSELGPSLDAMIVNIEKLGYTIKSKQNTSDNKDGEISPAVKREIAEAVTFFDNAVLDQELGSVTELRSRYRKDMELTGNAYIEMIPSMLDRTLPAGLNHIPSWTMRLGKRDEEYTEYEVPRAIRQEDGTYTIKFFRTSKRFRRFIQMDDTTSKPVYFKEWNDPRNISSVTGKVISDNDVENSTHEIIHNKLYSLRSPYGMPRWIGYLFSIYGTRAAEEINYVTLNNNQVPAMALLATNVSVTDGSIDRMQEFIEDRVQGNKNYATILIIEAEPHGEGLKDPNSMKMDLKPLTDSQHTDGMFINYIQNNNDMIRRSYRLPPIFVGRADDYNRAVAEASRKLAEEQIFDPERRSFDELMTYTILYRLGLANVAYVSNKPNVTDNYELTQLLATGERSGGLTPRISRRIVSDIVGHELPEVDEEINPDVPFSYTINKMNIDSEAEEVQEEVKGIMKSVYERSISNGNSVITLTSEEEAVISKWLCAV